VRLLGGGAAAAHDSRALAGQLHKLVLIVLQADLEDGTLLGTVTTWPGLQQEGWVDRVGKPCVSWILPVPTSSPLHNTPFLVLGDG
jgi:hypothetical protein